MKIIKIAFLLIVAFHFNSCTKMEWDLKKDNPFDSNNSSPTIDISSVTVVCDNNEDGKINSGETVYLKVYLTNNGTGLANDVSASFSSNSSYISSFSSIGDLHFGNIQRGATQYGGYSYAPNYYEYTLSFKVNQTTPIGTVIPIGVNIKDADGHNWSKSFNVTVEKNTANVIYTSFSLIYVNNQDGKINKRETVYLKVSFQNTGASNAKNLYANITTSNMSITQIYPSPINLGDISAGTTIFSSGGYAPNMYEYTFSFKVSNSATTGSINFNVNVYDDLNNQWNSSFNSSIQ